MNLGLDAIRADERCQPRTTFDNELVSQYAEAMANGAAFPPVVVFYDGVDHFLADGFHRYHAAQSLGLAEIDAAIKRGTLRDAILHSCSANADHGWRRTNDDKRRAVLRLLNDVEWVKWSDREIARQCNVSHEFVRKLRPEPSVNVDRYERKVERGGTVYTQNVQNIGSAPKLRDDDRPVFDRTETGTRWQDTAAPERTAQIDNVNRETGLASSIWDIIRLQQQLPLAKDAADRFPALLLHSLIVSDIRAAANWLAVFAEDIERRKDQTDVAA